MAKLRNWVLIALFAVGAGCSNEVELTPEEQQQADDTSTLSEEEVAAERAIK